MGLLAGEGSFTGDKVQPLVAIKMTIRHVGTLHWLDRNFPGGHVHGPYGPYADGRNNRAAFMVWRVDGPCLRERLVPLVQQNRDLLDQHVAARFDAMCQRYRLDSSRGAIQSMRAAD